LILLSISLIFQSDDVSEAQKNKYSAFLFALVIFGLIVTVMKVTVQFVQKRKKKQEPVRRTTGILTQEPLAVEMDINSTTLPTAGISVNWATTGQQYPEATTTAGLSATRNTTDQQNPSVF
jgi:hypothetical protein